jgi:hypothetical protein
MKGKREERKKSAERWDFNRHNNVQQRGDWIDFVLMAY